MSTANLPTTVAPPQQDRKLLLALKEALGKEARLTEVPGELVQSLGLDKSVMAACQPDNRMLAVREANGESLAFGQLTRAKVPSGGGVHFSVNNLGNEEAVKSISGALIVWHKRAVLWPTDGDAADGTQPILVSDDLQRAYYNPRFEGDDWGDIDKDLIEAARIEGTNFFDMATLHYNQWGTGRNDGKRMKEQRIAGILPPDSIYPVILNINPGSLGNVVPIIAKLPHFHYGTLVTVSLEPAENKSGTKYSRVVLRVDGYLSDAESLVLKTMFTDPLHAAIKSSDLQVDAG